MLSFSLSLSLSLSLSPYSKLELNYPWQWWDGPKYPLEKGRLQRRRISAKLPFAKPFMLAWLVASTVRRQHSTAMEQRRALSVWQNRALRALHGSRRSALTNVECVLTLLLCCLVMATSYALQHS